MNLCIFKLAALAGFMLTGIPAAAGVLSNNCRTAEQPAATLLFPYFEVDLQGTDGATTLISINNASSKPTVARVVLWTDWGAPSLAFDVYLTGYDVQSINLRDLLHGRIPGTGPVVSPRGSLSDESPSFPDCQGNAKAVTAFTSTSWEHVRAAHSGQPLPGTNPAQCLGSGDKGATVATGYVTVDVVNRCTPPSIGKKENTPADPTYFVAGGKGLASDDNVLWGEYFSLSSRLNLADSQTAVHILADPDFFSDGDYTFYARYVGYDSRDDRAPLSSLYYVRYLDGGPFSGGTDLIVWRDNRDAAIAPQSCGKSPSWAPLGEYQMFVFDEEENPTQIPNSQAFPLATQKVHVGSDSLKVSSTYGWMMIDLWHLDATHAQGWVGTTMSAEGRFSVSHAAIRADDLCNFGI